MRRGVPESMRSALAAAELGAVFQDEYEPSGEVSTWTRERPDEVLLDGRWVKQYQETFGPKLPADWTIPLPERLPLDGMDFTGTEPMAMANALQNPGPELTSLLGALAAGRGGLAGVLGKALQAAGKGDALSAVAAASGGAGGSLAQISQFAGPGRELAMGLLQVAGGKFSPVELLRGFAGKNLPDVLTSVGRFLPPQWQRLSAMGQAAGSKDPAAAVLGMLPPQIRQLVPGALSALRGDLPRALGSLAGRFAPPQLRPLLRIAQEAGGAARLLHLPLAPFLPQVGKGVAPGPDVLSARGSKGGVGPWAARMTDGRQCPTGSGAIVTPCAPTVLVGNLPAARQTDLATCSSGPPDSIAKGEGTVLIGGLPAARLGDPTVHGGLVIAGLPTVWIGTSSAGKAQCMKRAAQNGAAMIAQLDGGE